MKVDRKNSFASKTKVVTLVAMLAGLSMGNESCEKAQQGPRFLRMDVELGTMNARPVTLPSGEKIDFPYVVNTLFYRQVMNNDHFVILNPIPAPTSGATTQSLLVSAKDSADATAGNSLGTSLVSERDLSLLSQFGYFSKNSSASLHGEFSSGQSQSKTLQELTKSPPLPACLYNLPQAQLGGDVISFEATWGVGVGIGYGQNGDSINAGAGGKVDFSESKLELGVYTKDPLSEKLITSADGVSTQEKIKLSADFSLGIPLGINFFLNTPITDVIRNAMDSGLTSLVDQYLKTKSNRNSWDDVWESRVIDDRDIVNGDTEILIRGGERANVKVGDKFVVTNMKYKFEGAECYTRLAYKVPETTPVAEVEVISVGDDVAVAVVKRRVTDSKIIPGAQVKILSLVQPQPSPTPAPQQ